MEHLNQEQVLALEPRDQYLYFVYKVVATGEIWGLHNDDMNGWAMTTTDGNKELLPIWPTAAFAEDARQEQWQSFTPLVMDLDIFIRETLDELIDQGRGLSVFYLDGQGGLDIEPEQLRKDVLTLKQHQEGE